jgi:hypothetical protein
VITRRDPRALSLLAGAQRHLLTLTSVADAFQETAHDAEIHVRFEQRHPNGP